VDAIGLIPSFGSLASTVVAFVVALSLIVAVHEYGHYIVGRWTGIHAEVFSLGFGPVLWSRTDRRGTRWQVAALPFGGFVKFLGDADAASGRDAAAMSRLGPAERRRTMHGAPVWARALTVAAGPAFNFAMAVAVFLAYALVTGVATDAPTVGSLKPTPFAGDSLRPGDRILALNGTPTPDYDSLVTVGRALPPAPAVSYTVDRGGERLDVEGPFPFPPIADGVQPQTAAIAAGLAEGDVIVAVDGEAVHSFEQIRDRAGASEGRAMRLTVWRAGETFDVTLVPRRQDLPRDGGGFETRWLIGLSGGLVFEPETRSPGLWEALTLAVAQTWEVIVTSLSGLWHIVSGAISSCNLQGPIGIAETSGALAAQGLDRFVLFIATLSTAVGLLNLFPVPVLDGGHLVFHAWEAATGRPPSDRALKALMSFGLACLLGLMAFALSNDIFCP
jgi:regulator of sigma E protease